MTSSIFTSLFRRTPTPSKSPSIVFPFTLESNPYKCKRPWPPDFAQLSHKHQFRLEKRFRRRTQLQWARPNWNKAVQLTQWTAILFTLGYGLLYMEIDERLTPIVNLRRRYHEQLEIFTGARNHPT